MQIGISGTSGLLLIAYWVFFYGVLALAAIRVFGWLVDRRTAELRQRVALLEHQVSRLEDDRDDQ